MEEREAERGEVHVWRVSLEEAASQFEGLRLSLTLDELTRAERFHFPEDRKKFILARGMLKKILGRYLETAPEEIVLGCGPYGRPELANRALRFNVSHSHGFALFALAPEREIGVDIEYINSDLPIGDIAEQVFPELEVVILGMLPEEMREKVFFTFWTRREALLKARGTGFACGREALRKLSWEFQDNAPWSVKDLDVGPGYAAALAARGKGMRIICRDWSEAAHP